jgi:hypothetical protein
MFVLGPTVTDCSSETSISASLNLSHNLFDLLCASSTNYYAKLICLILHQDIDEGTHERKYCEHSPKIIHFIQIDTPLTR